MRLLVPLLVVPLATVACFYFLYRATEDPHLALSLLARDPVSMVELQLLQIQQNPDAGLYVLADLQLPPWTGLLHHLNCFLWLAAACVCAFETHLRPHPLLYTLGTLSFMLFLDEFLLLHERLLPAAQTFALPLALVVGVLFALALLSQWRALRGTSLALLAASALSFVLMLAADHLNLPSVQSMYLEEAAKLNGIMLWTSYVCHAAAAALKLPATAPTGAPIS